MIDIPTAPGDKDGRVFLKGVILLTVCGFILRAWGLSSQQLSGDDIEVAVSAVRYMESGHLGTMWHHPELRNILVYASMSISGGVWGLKSISLILGSLSVPLLALTSRQIIKHEGAALMAAFFLAVDPLHIDFSRQAVHEVYMMFFALLGIFLSLRFKDNPKPALLFMGCAGFGLGIASKWYVAFPMAITFLYLLYDTVKKPVSDGRLKRHTAVFLSVAFFAVPATVYLLTFIPWFQRGFTLSEWVALQLEMFREASTHRGNIPYTVELEHKAYLWFVKPVVFADFTYGKDGPGVLLGMGNPFVWLLTIPALLYAGVEAVKKRHGRNCFLAGLFCFSYFPFVLAKRPIWVHSAFSVLPFAFMAIAYFLTDIAGSKPNRKRLLLFYLLMVTIAAVPLYILAVGKGFQIPLFKPLFELYRPSFEQ